MIKTKYLFLSLIFLAGCSREPVSTSGIYCSETKKGFSMLFLNEDGGYRLEFIKDNDTTINEGTWIDEEIEIHLNDWRKLDSSIIGCDKCTKSGIKRENGNLIMFDIIDRSEDYRRCNSSGELVDSNLLILFYWFYYTFPEIIVYILLFIYKFLSPIFLSLFLLLLILSVPVLM